MATIDEHRGGQASAGAPGGDGGRGPPRKPLPTDKVSTPVESPRKGSDNRPKWLKDISTMTDRDNPEKRWVNTLLKTKKNMDKLVEYLQAAEEQGLYDLGDRLTAWVDTELARDADPRRGHEEINISNVSFLSPLGNFPDFLQHPYHLPYLLAQMADSPNSRHDDHHACVQCQEGSGHFRTCRTPVSAAGTTLGGACVNCSWNGHPETCSFHPNYTGHRTPRKAAARGHRRKASDGTVNEFRQRLMALRDGSPKSGSQLHVTRDPNISVNPPPVSAEEAARYRRVSTPRSPGATSRQSPGAPSPVQRSPELGSSPRPILSPVLAARTRPSSTRDRVNSLRSEEGIESPGSSREQAIRISSTPPRGISQPAPRRSPIVKKEPREIPDSDDEG